MVLKMGWFDSPNIFCDFLEILTDTSNAIVRRGTAQDVPYDLILWYVSKIIYLS